MANSKTNVPHEKQEDKVVYTVAELMAEGSSQPKYLMPPIFPQKGMCCFSRKTRYW